MDTHSDTHACGLYIDTGSGPKLVHRSSWIDREDCDLFIRNGALSAKLQLHDGTVLYEVFRVPKRDDIYARRHRPGGGIEIVSLKH